jgi:hypothetical protein
MRRNLKKERRKKTFHEILSHFKLKTYFLIQNTWFLKGVSLGYKIITFFAKISFFSEKGFQKIVFFEKNTSNMRIECHVNKIY